MSTKTQDTHCAMNDVASAAKVSKQTQTPRCPQVTQGSHQHCWQGCSWEWKTRPLKVRWRTSKWADPLQPCSLQRKCTFKQGHQLCELLSRVTSSGLLESQLLKWTREKICIRSQNFQCMFDSSAFYIMGESESFSSASCKMKEEYVTN